MRFSEIVWTLFRALGSPSVCIDFCVCACVFSVYMDSFVCACVSKCFHGLLCLRLSFSVFVEDSCAYACVSSVCTDSRLALAFLSDCMGFCICAYDCDRFAIEIQLEFLIKREKEKIYMWTEHRRFNFLFKVNSIKHLR